VPDFIALAEARLARDLRLQRMITTQTLVTVAGTETVSLPTGWLEWRRLRVQSPSQPVEYLSASQWAEKYAYTDSGAPVNYLVEGQLLRLGPKPDAVYSIDVQFYKAVDALSVTASNWLLTAHPGLYLWAALAEAAPFMAADQRVQLWETKYQADLLAARAADARAMSSGSNLRARAR
jgi:NADH:ubiquinone oxidoreductase subunit